jgi:hypothetical protein
MTFVQVKDATPVISSHDLRDLCSVHNERNQRSSQSIWGRAAISSR